MTKLPRRYSSRSKIIVRITPFEAGDVPYIGSVIGNSRLSDLEDIGQGQIYSSNPTDNLCQIWKETT